MVLLDWPNAYLGPTSLTLKYDGDLTSRTNDGNWELVFKIEVS